MSRNGMTITNLAQMVPTEADAWKLMEDLRWNGTPVCPTCGSEDVFFLNPANGVSRKTRTGTMSERRVWKCSECRRQKRSPQFSVTTGTIFHGSKVPLRTWLFVVFEMCASKNGVAAREIERKYGVTAKTAWFITQRIREAMAREPLAGLIKMRGTIVADETYVGGAPKNKHRQGVRRRPTGEHARDHVEPKAIVLTLVNKTTGEARSQVIREVTSQSLGDAINEQVDLAESVLHTDKLPAYREIGQHFGGGHEAVDHHRHEYVRGDVTTNQAENYFSQFKRSIDGTHHRLSKVHLFRYVGEFDFRYSTRKLSDEERMWTLMGQTGGKRLTYKPLTGKD